MNIDGPCLDGLLHRAGDSLGLMLAHVARDNRLDEVGRYRRLCPPGWVTRAHLPDRVGRSPFRREACGRRREAVFGGEDGGCRSL